MQKNHNQIHKIIDLITFSDGSLVADRISDIIEKDRNIGFSIDITNISQQEAEKTREKIVKKLNELKLFQKITIILTSNRASTSKQKTQPKIIIERVKKIIAIVSGKGGVGKSMVTALLAHKLQQQGKKIGIIDADIYGPSMPNIFNLTGKPQLLDGKMLPLENYHIKINSIGFLTKPGHAISWRGPMVSKALYQLLSLTNWGELDYLLIDTPPGTGDTHLSLLQNYQLDQVLIVTTPQKIAQLDVVKIIDLYQKFEIKFAGIIENMSYYQEVPTAKKIAIFSGQAGHEIADQYQLPLLAQIPVKPSLSDIIDQGGDLGQFTYLLANFNL